INYEVPAGHEAIAPVTQTVEYTRDVNGVAGYQDPVTGDITWNPWHVKSGKAEFASASVEQIKGYDSYVDGTKATEVSAAAVVEKDGVPQNGANVTVSYQKQGNIPVKWDGTKDNMTMKVTRTINYQVPEGQAAIAPVTQTVEYTREDAQGNAGYTDPATGITTWNAWHVADNGSAEFPSTQVEQIKGYDSYVDGTKATEVPAAQVTEKDGEPQNGANVTVSYQKQADTVVPYDPSNKDMNMSVTRTINYEVPAGHEAIAPVTQTVEYT
ncbi:mucin-binding protein, partial [Limosilactobacillus reuteri]